VTDLRDSLDRLSKDRLQWEKEKSRIIRIIGHLDREYIVQLNLALYTILGLSDDEVAQIAPEE
jgi:hypothetical protein